MDGESQEMDDRIAWVGITLYATQCWNENNNRNITKILTTAIKSIFCSMQLGKMKDQHLSNILSRIVCQISRSIDQIIAFDCASLALTNSFSESSANIAVVSYIAKD